MRFSTVGIVAFLIAALGAAAGARSQDAAGSAAQTPPETGALAPLVRVTLTVFYFQGPTEWRSHTRHLSRRVHATGLLVSPCLLIASRPALTSRGATDLSASLSVSAGLGPEGRFRYVALPISIESAAADRGVLLLRTSPCIGGEAGIGHLRFDAVPLRDGTPVVVAPIAAEDGPARLVRRGGCAVRRGRDGAWTHACLAGEGTEGDVLIRDEAGTARVGGLDVGPAGTGEDGRTEPARRFVPSELIRRWYGAQIEADIRQFRRRAPLRAPARPS